MAKIEHVHHRLERWAMWVHRGRRSGGGGGMLPMFQGYRPEVNVAREAVVPIQEEECWRTEEAIKQLPEEMASTVGMYYLHDSSYTQRQFGISSSVLSQRIDSAHRMLARSFAQSLAASVSTHRPPEWLG